MHGEPMTEEKLAEFSHAKKEEVRGALQELGKEYQERGFTLLQKDGADQLGTQPDAARDVEELVKGEFSEELSRAAIETAAIIAYKGPLTRAEIEYVRGVNSSFTVRNLLMRGLVERIENPKDTRSYLYRVSMDFLKHFGLARIEELPEYAALQKERIEILEEVKNQASSLTP